MASELATFAALCQRLGLPITVEPYAAEDSFLAFRAPAAAQQAQCGLAFGQNQLYVDLQGRFLGTLGDENGAWEPRVASRSSPQETSP